MWYLVSSRQWRERLSYAAMSLLVIWHTLAMVVAPSPDSELTWSARKLFEPYLTLFMLENGWSFFAPDVSSHPEFRYIVEDAAGQRHTFVPSERWNQFRLTWVRDWYRYMRVMDFPEDLRRCCRRRTLSRARLVAADRDHVSEDRTEGLLAGGSAGRNRSIQSSLM